MTDHSHDAPGVSPGSPQSSEGPPAESSTPSAESIPPPPKRKPTGREKRRPGGRDRPYQVLRVVAKLYAILAPFVLVGMILVGLAGLMRAVPFTEKVGSALGLILLAGLYYLLMRAISEAIYILFDVAKNVHRIRQLLDPHGHDQD